MTTPEPAPPLSVVVPSRNTRQLTLACLASLAAAGALPQLAAMEVVLVDDAGSDGTADAVAERFPRVRLLRLGTRAGFTRAANLGLAAARGEVLLLLNSDTEVEGAGLAALPDRFASAPRLGIGGAALRYPDGTPQWSGGGEPTAAWLLALASGLPALLGRLRLWRRLRPASGSGGGRGGASGSGDGASGGGGGSGSSGGGGAVAWVTGAAMAMRRATWEQVGPLDERFAFYAQDLDLCLRARDAGWEVAILPGLRVVHHHGATIAGEGEGGGGRLEAGQGKIGREGGGSGQRDDGRGSRGSRGVQHTELLWTDLVRWAAKRGGPAAARRAARALVAGGTVRRLACGVLAALATGARRGELRAEAAALGAALGAVRQTARREQELRDEVRDEGGAQGNAVIRGKWLD